MENERHRLDLDALRVETFDSLPRPGADPALLMAAGVSDMSGCRDCDTDPFICGTSAAV